MSDFEKQKCATCGVPRPLCEFSVVWRGGDPFPGPVCLSCEANNAPPDLILAPGEKASQWSGRQAVYLEARALWLQAERRVGWMACLRTQSQKTEGT